MFETSRTNTILYCRQWSESVDFYRNALKLSVSSENDWFVEFQLTENSFLSIANAARATINNVGGQGITLAWQVTNLGPLKSKLASAGIQATDIRQKWNASTLFVLDPEGHRIEFWQPNTSSPVTTCDLTTSVPDWVIEHPSLLPLFQELGIDYCCGGKSLESACRAQELDLDSVFEKVNSLLKNSGRRG